MEELSSNDVLNCLWNKDSAEKCRIGLSDVVVYENSVPSKWYVTGKTGEISRKRNVDFKLIGPRWSKIGEQSQSPIVAIVRQHGGILKFLNEDAWRAFTENIVADPSVLSLHCFIKGDNKMIYRNKYELKDKLGRYVSSTHVYNLSFDHTIEAVSVQFTEHAVLTESKAAALKSVIDLATNTVVRYLELMLSIKVVQITIDYVIDSQSQLWMMWSSPAQFVRGKNLNEIDMPGIPMPRSANRMTWAGPKLREGEKDMEFEHRMPKSPTNTLHTARSDSPTRSPGSRGSRRPRTGASEVDEDDTSRFGDASVNQLPAGSHRAQDVTVSLAHQQVSGAEDIRSSRSKTMMRKKGGLIGTGKEVASFEIEQGPSAVVPGQAFPDPFKCKGDYCRARVMSTGPLMHRAGSDITEKLFSEAEIETLRKDKRFAQMMEFNAAGPALAAIGMKSIVKAREERRGIQSTSALPWEAYPVSPRSNNNYDNFVRSMDSIDGSSISTVGAKDEVNEQLAQDKVHREQFTKGMITYYEQVRVCGICYNVYCILDWARGVLGKSGAHGEIQKAPKHTSKHILGNRSTSMSVLTADSDVFSTASGDDRSTKSAERSLRDRNQSVKPLPSVKSASALLESKSPNPSPPRSVTMAGSMDTKDRSKSPAANKDRVKNQRSPARQTATMPKVGTWKDYVGAEQLKTHATGQPTSKAGGSTINSRAPVEPQKLKDLDDYLRKGAEALTKRKQQDKVEFMNTRVSQLLAEQNLAQSSTISTQPSNISVGGGSTNAYRGKILLACEENTYALEALGILESAFFDVYWTKDGRSAINTYIARDSTPDAFDCVLVHRTLVLSDAVAVTSSVRDCERKSRRREAKKLSEIGSGAPPQQRRHPVICLTDTAGTEDIKGFMEADMDGCVSYPINAASLLNTIRAAIPHHLAVLSENESPLGLNNSTVITGTANNKEQKVFKIGALGILEGATDSATQAMATIPLSTAGEDYSTSGIIQIDADTRIPYTVLDSSRNAKVRFKKKPFFNLVVCHDMFDTSERLKIVLRGLAEQYMGLQILLWNYPGQAFTEWRPEQLLNNEYIATCLNELLGQVGEKGTKDFDTTKPFYILGFGYGGNIGAYYAAHYRVLNLRGLIQVNSWTFLDSYLAGLLHDCVNVFECSPPSRPDLPIYFFSRFLFSKEYLAKVSVPLALNLYTAVHNPISITGRLGLCKGVLKSVDLRPSLKEIDCPIICIHSTQDSLARPMQTDAYVQCRNGEVRSIHKALKNPTKTCIVWIKSGHEVFQEQKKQVVTVIEQIITGFHETNDISFSTAAAVDIGANERGQLPASVTASGDRNSNATVEDKFIDNILSRMSKVRGSSSPNAGNSRTASPNRTGSPSKAPPQGTGRGITAAPSLASTLPSITGSNLAEGSASQLFSATDPNVWKQFAADLHSSQDITVVNKQRARKQKDDDYKPNLVLDPSSLTFERQDSVYKRPAPSDNTYIDLKDGHKNNLQEYPEVKEYMSWRLKRNKKRLHRLHQAARAIQGGFRAHLARQFVKRVRRQRAATTIQRFVRGWLGRCQFLEQVRRMWGTLTIQRVYRGFLARKLYFVLKTRHAAAANIQRVVRGHQARVFINKVRLIRGHAATMIQSLYRRRKARKLVWRKRLERNASMLVQRIFRGHLGRKKAIAERDRYIFSRSQSQGIEFGRQMLLEHKLHATRLQSDVTLLTQEKVSAEESVEALLEEISGFEEGVRTLEKEMHQLAKVEAEAAAFMDADSKYELREQKIRLDKEFGEMLVKISTRKESLTSLEKKLAAIDKTRQGKEEELRTLERKLVVLLEEQQNELNAIKRKQDIRGQLLAASHDEIMKATNAVPGQIANADSNALVVSGGGGGGGGGYGGPSLQEKRQAAQLMQSTETLMKFGFMSMSMTYFSSLNMIKALRTVSAQDTVMAALADVHAQRAVGFGAVNHAISGDHGAQGKDRFMPDLKRGQLPGQEALRVSAWSVDDVAKWLHTISLSQYSEAFIDAAIDGEFLYDLNDDDLKNTLGIEHRLHRKKILNCVHRLKLAEAQADSRLNAILHETGSMDAPNINPDIDPNAGLPSNPFTGDAGKGDMGDRRFIDGPKAPLSELFSYVRHAKLNLLKEALDYLPNKPFDPSLVQVLFPLRVHICFIIANPLMCLFLQSKYVRDHGTVYLDGYDRLPFHLNKTDEWGNNMLCLACQNGNTKVVKYLIAKGSNMNHQNKAGQTPAHFAVAYKFFDLSKWMFENGADDTIENKFSLTPYDGLMPEGYVEGEDDGMMAINN
jgi:pimeloyl-ACP methyl ester carboxylesterase/CheY-like chemotaxis protein